MYYSDKFHVQNG